MSYPSINAFFKLDDGAATPVPTDISNFLDAITPSSQTDELDGTTFQPGVASPVKDIIAGFHNLGISLGVKWTPAAETFFSGIENKAGLNYLYGPLGSEVGMTAIAGLCNCLSWTGPISTVAGIITGTCELRATTRQIGTFSATGTFTPAP
jgi:Na+/H+-translocating membrane pyrophosphatase